MLILKRYGIWDKRRTSHHCEILCTLMTKESPIVKSLLSRLQQLRNDETDEHEHRVSYDHHCTCTVTVLLSYIQLRFSWTRRAFILPRLFLVVAQFLSTYALNYPFGFTVCTAFETLISRWFLFAAVPNVVRRHCTSITSYKMDDKRNWTRTC